ncbi:MAG: hypothetical protein K2L72_03020, partial [Clostridia bacterium]|nr:hypothetical protein [Clostridia bacterium]
IVRKGESGAKSVDLSQKTLIEDGFNDLNYYPEAYGGERCDELIGLNSKAKYDSSKDEFDSAWNDCQVSGVKNVTVEGVGEDARIFQWGMTFKSCDSIEVRNLTFEDYTEDACSFEASETSASTLSAFKHGNIWLHHNTFEEGVNYWDVCNEQDKHDGDGSTDFKGVKNITLSYNVYNSTHKTGLIGGSNTQTTANVTFHHNVYNNCKARLPLARQANMHMYNNYYNGTTSTDLSLRANAYAFVENCYFESGNNCPVELQYDATNGSGAAKLVGCVINQSRIKIANGVASTNLGVNVGREDTVTNANKYGKNFDTDPSLFYCKTVDGKIVTDVTHMLTAEQTREIVPKIAGVQQRGGDVTLGGGTGSGDNGETGDGDNTGGGNTGDNTGGETGGEVVSSVTFNAANCGLAEGGLFTETDNGLFGLITNDDGKKFSVTTLLAAGGGTEASANDNSGLKFDKVFLSSGTGGTMTLTAKEDITVTVYYTITNSAFNTTDQSKAGYLTWTVNGGSETTDTNTESKSGRTAYAVTITLNKGDVCVMTASANRLAVFGFVANHNA